MGYALPTWTDWVTASWQDHKNRNPPSQEPGTDYGAGYGSDVYAVDDGTVTYTKSSNSGGMGRVVEYVLNDGRTTRTLHMARVDVRVGQKVQRGQRLGLSGASGYGDDWYYGPHVHQTLWPTCAWCLPTIDFALYVGDVPAPTPPTHTPTPEEVLAMSTEVIVTVKDNNGKSLPDNKRRTAFVNTDSGFFCDFSWMTVADADRWAKAIGQSSALQFSDAGFDKFRSQLELVRATPGHAAAAKD